MSTISKKKYKFNRKKQNFNGLKIIYSDDVFDGKKVRKNVKVVGRVKRDMPYVTRFNPRTMNESYLTDYNALPTNLKNRIIKDFSSKGNRKVLYLVDK